MKKSDKQIEVEYLEYLRNNIPDAHGIPSREKENEIQKQYLDTKIRKLKHALKRLNL